MAYIVPMHVKPKFNLLTISMGFWLVILLNHYLYGCLLIDKYVIDLPSRSCEPYLCPLYIEDFGNELLANLYQSVPNLKECSE